MQYKLDQDFRDDLEYAITKALSYSNLDELKGLWCDGVDIHIPNTEAFLSRFKEGLEMSGVAWIGKDTREMTSYDLILRFTQKSKQAYLQGEDLNPFIPDLESGEWIYVHLETKHIVVYLS